MRRSARDSWSASSTPSPTRAPPCPRGAATRRPRPAPSTRSASTSAPGRVVYLAEEMAVLTRARRVVLAGRPGGRRCAEPEDDPRMAWVVADEGKGLDLVLEVLHHGRPQEGPRRQRRALRAPRHPRVLRLRPRQQQIHGYRLPPAARALPAHRAAARPLPLRRAGPRPGAPRRQPPLLLGRGRAPRAPPT